LSLSISIDIPVTEETSWKLYNIHAIPNVQNGTITTFSFDHAQALVSYNALIELTEMGRCIIHENERVCETSGPRFKLAANTPSCLASIFFNKKIEMKTCRQHITKTRHGSLTILERNAEQFFVITPQQTATTKKVGGCGPTVISSHTIEANYKLQNIVKTNQSCSDEIQRSNVFKKKCNDI